jgi:hypothetical protein
MNLINKIKKGSVDIPNLKKKIYFILGFSLIEIIVYFAIFTAISIVVINSFIVILSSFRVIRSSHDLLNSGSFSMERISRDIRQAQNIDIVNSQINGGESLQLNSTDIDGSNMIIKFIKEEGALNIYKNNELVGNLLDQNIIINSLSFNRISTAKSEGVKIKIILQDTKDRIERSESFYNTVTLRGSIKN